MVNIYEINLWSYTQYADFTLKNYLFGAIEFAKNVVLDKYSYSG